MISHFFAVYMLSFNSDTTSGKVTATLITHIPSLYSLAADFCYDSALRYQKSERWWFKALYKRFLFINNSADTVYKCRCMTDHWLPAHGPWYKDTVLSFKHIAS